MRHTTCDCGRQQRGSGVVVGDEPTPECVVPSWEDSCWATVTTDFGDDGTIDFTTQYSFAKWPRSYTWTSYEGTSVDSQPTSDWTIRYDSCNHEIERRDTIARPFRLRHIYDVDGRLARTERDEDGDGGDERIER